MNDEQSFDSRVGLCSMCRHARVVESGRGARFWLCQLTRTDARFRKYPPLPVRDCPGFEPLTPGEGAPTR